MFVVPRPRMLVERVQFALWEQKLKRPNNTKRVMIDTRATCNQVAVVKYVIMTT